jgi:hypothetical protein
MRVLGVADTQRDVVQDPMVALLVAVRLEEAFLVADLPEEVFPVVVRQEEVFLVVDLQEEVFPVVDLPEEAFLVVVRLSNGAPDDVAPNCIKCLPG